MSRPRSAPTLFAALAALSAPAFASELPQSPTIVLPDDGRARAVGDVNGDGAPDVLVTADSLRRRPASGYVRHVLPKPEGPESV